MTAGLPSREPDLGDLLRLMARHRRLLARGALCGLAAGILFLLLAVPQYRATMLVAPVTRSATTDFAGPLPENAGYGTEYLLRSFAAGDTADFAWFEQIARGPRVAALLLPNKAIMAGIAGDRSFRLGHGQSPGSADALSAYLRDRVAIEPVGSTALRRVTYDHPDRRFAAQLLQTLYDTADRMMRGDMQARADRRIAWLRRTIPVTQNPDDQRAMAALLTAQQQLRIALALDEPYAARIAEPPSAGIRKVWPRGSLLLPVFAFAGALAGAALALSRR